MNSDKRILEGYRLLVVEYGHDLTSDLKDVLADLGAMVHGPFGDLVDAKDRIASDGLEVAVLDINMRSAKAFEIAEDLTGQNVPFVFASGYGATDIPARFRHIRRWEKPYDARALATDVHYLCKAMTGRNKPVE